MAYYGKSEEITREDLEVVGRNNDIQDSKTFIDSVADAVAKFEELARELDIDKKRIEAIQGDFVKF